MIMCLLITLMKSRSRYIMSWEHILLREENIRVHFAVFDALKRKFLVVYALLLEQKKIDNTFLQNCCNLK